MWQKTKDGFANMRRHKKLFALLFILAGICTRMFIQNYDLQQPIVNKRSETYMQVWNERAVCLQELEFKRNAVSSINEDIMQ